MKQGGGYWTQDEREKATYVAKRALLAGQDPRCAVMRYMGMDEIQADISVRQAEALLASNGVRRRPVRMHLARA